MEIKIVNKSTNPIPTYATEGSAGMDLRASLKEFESIIIRPGERKLISTGISIQLPKGYEAQIRPRSGLALKNGITVLNSPGTVDMDFTGTVGVILMNQSIDNFIVNNGDRIAQMVISKYEKANFIVVDELKETERGDGGFGHTGNL